MEVIVHPAVLKYLARLDKKARQRIDKALKGLAEDPPRGDIKKMKGISMHRLRVGGLRIVFSIGKDAVFVEKIAPRGDVYKGGR